MTSSSPHQGMPLDRFAWLFGIGYAPCAPPDAAEFDQACELAIGNWRSLPMILPRLARWGSAYAGQSGAYRHAANVATAVKVLGAVQLTLCRRLTSEFERQQIPYCLLKGIAVRLGVYPDSGDRGSLDLDIGVPYSYLDDAVASAQRLGFLPAALTDANGRYYRRADPAAWAAIRDQHYELGTLARHQIIRGLESGVESAIRESIENLLPWHLTKSGEPACYVTLDIHHGICLDIDIEPVVAARVNTPNADYAPAVPSLPWMLFHLVYKIYWEGVHNYRKGAYQYADVVRVVPKLAPSEISEFVGLLKEYRLEAAGFYVLRRLATAFNMSLPPELQNFIDATEQPPVYSYPEEVNDLGDMWPKIWGYR
jgi:Uncharacterised nucleotidyltransferase